MDTNKSGEEALLQSDKVEGSDEVTGSSDSSSPSLQSTSGTSIEPGTHEDDDDTGLDELVSSDGEKLLAFVDEIRKIDGLSHIKLDLPQLVVVGNTSCGKSSLLQALTRLPFPVSPGLCTHFATETVIRRCGPTKRPGYKITVRDPVSGSAPHPDHFPKEYANQNWQDVYRQLKEDIASAFAAMKGSQDLPEQDSSPGSSKDPHRSRLQEIIMTVEVAKPDQAHFSVVDIPGLVTNTPQKDVELSKKLAEKYIKNPCAIVLAVFSGIDAIENQSVQKLVDEAGAASRCIGVITKCDAVAEGDEEKVLNTINTPGHVGALLGCYAIRNRPTIEIKSSQPSFNARDDRERAFFFDDDGWQRKIDRRFAGIDNLRNRLAGCMYRQVKKSFPNIRNRMKASIDDLKQALENMGQARDTREPQLSYLTRIQGKYKGLMDRALYSHYDGQPSFDDSYKLRQNIRKLDMDFNESLRSEGLAHPFKTLQEDADTFRGIEDVDELKEKMLEQGGTYAWILNTCDRLMGPEPPLDSPPHVKQVLFNEQTKSWAPISKKFHHDVVEFIKEYNDHSFEQICDDPELRERLRGMLYEKEKCALDRAAKELDTLLHDQGQRLHTNDPRLGEHLNLTTQARITGDVNYVQINELPHEAIVHSLHTNKLISARVFEHHDYLKAYCDIAMSRFIDNVGVQVIERHLLGEHGPLTVFSSEWIASMDEEKLDALVGESKETKERRVMLQKNIDTLSDALRRADMLSYAR